MLKPNLLCSTLLAIAMTWGCSGNPTSSDPLNPNDPGAQSDGSVSDASTNGDASVGNDASTNDGSIVTPPNGKLKYAPPAGWESFTEIRVPVKGGAYVFEPGKGYLLIAPDEPITGHIEIDGGYHPTNPAQIVMIGGEFHYTTFNPVGWFPFQIADAGDVFIEGIKFTYDYFGPGPGGGAGGDPFHFGGPSDAHTNSLTLQNIWVGELYGHSDDIHSDMLQMVGGGTRKLDTFRAYNVSAEELHGTGFYFPTNTYVDFVELENIDTVTGQGPTAPPSGDTDAGGDTAQMRFWDREVVVKTVGDTVWVAPNFETHGGIEGEVRLRGERLDASDTHTDELGTYLRDQLGNKWREGRPPGGSYVNESKVGAGYVSPGYQ